MIIELLQKRKAATQLLLSLSPIEVASAAPQHTLQETIKELNTLILSETLPESEKAIAREMLKTYREIQTNLLNNLKSDV